MRPLDRHIARLFATLLGVATVFAASSASQPGPQTVASHEQSARQITILVRVSTADNTPVPTLPVVADRTLLAPASPAPCAWTNAQGLATLILRVPPDATEVRVALATVAPGCGAPAESHDDTSSTDNWPARLDRLMKTNAFPAEVRVPIPAPEASASVSLHAEIRARPALRVLARVKYLRDRVLFATPEREWAFNPMWQLFALAERVPTDRVILDGVPADASPDNPTRIRLTSNSGGVSRIVSIDPSRATPADFDGVAGRQLDLGDILIPQEIDRAPVNEHITTETGPLLVGRTIPLTLASKQHPGLLFHIDVLGGARQPAPNQRDQRAYLPAGTFAIVPTRALRGPAGFFAFFDAVMNAPTEAASGFPTIIVDPANGPAGTDLEFDEAVARRVAEAITR
jgi:hypothetical protein